MFELKNFLETASDTTSKRQEILDFHASLIEFEQHGEFFFPKQKKPIRLIEDSNSYMDMESFVMMAIPNLVALTCAKNPTLNSFNRDVFSKVLANTQSKAKEINNMCLFLEKMEYQYKKKNTEKFEVHLYLDLILHRFLTNCFLRAQANILVDGKKYLTSEAKF